MKNINNNLDYLRIKKFVIYFGDIFFPSTIDKVSNFRDSISSLEKGPPSQILKGVTMAANDILDWTDHWEVDKVTSADSELKALGAFTLSEWRVRQSKKLVKLLARGSIKNLVEYYFLKAILLDGSPMAEELIKIDAMVNAFEASYDVARSKD
jgi:hypothetical protein